MDNSIVFSSDAVNAMIAVAAVCTLFPLIFLAYYKTKNREVKISSFFLGILFTLLFSFIGETIINMIFLVGFNLQVLLVDHPVYTAIYYSVVTGTMAQVGTYVALKYAMKNKTGKKNAFLFGIGKGGFECIIYGGIVYITNIMLAVMVNNFGIDDYLSKMEIGSEEMIAQMNAIASLASVPASYHLMDGTLRIASLLLYVGLTILVYIAVTYKPYAHFFPVAIVLHIVGSVPVYLYQTKVLTNPTWILGATGALVFIILIFAYRMYHSEVVD